MSSSSSSWWRWRPSTSAKRSSSAHSADRPPLGVVLPRQDKPVVVSAAPIAALGSEPGAAVADALRLAAVEGGVHESVAADGDRRLLLREVDVLPLAGAAFVVECGQHRPRSHEAAKRIR